MKVLVTGGAGFIGSHIVDAYINSGHQVIIFDNLSTGVKENLNPKAKFFHVDICSDEAIKLFVKEKPKILNHHAAQIRVDLATKDPVMDVTVNTLSVIRFMEAAKSHKFLKKVIFASTGGAMYGEKPVPHSEKITPQPVSPYGISKRAAELYLHYYYHTYNIPYIALRYSNVYGPRQNPHGEAGVVSIFCESILSGKHPTINGDGTQTRDYVFVKDVVNANMLVTKKEIIGFYNIGTSVETDVNTIYKLVSQNLNYPKTATHGPPRPGEQQKSSLDFSLATKKLSWQPKTKLYDGIRQTVNFFKQKQQA